jgi:hypothetical protein
VGNAIGTNNVNLTNNITVNPIPNVDILQNDTILCADNSITLSVSGADTYIWRPALGLNDSTSSIVTALPEQPIIYVVTGTTSAGCVSSDTISIDTTVCLGLTTAKIESDFKIYYDSNSGFINIKTGQSKIEHQNLIVYNALGQHIFEIEINLDAGINRALIDCQFLSTGAYFVALSDSSMKLKTEKLLINKQ